MAKLTIPAEESKSKRQAEIQVKLAKIQTTADVEKTRLQSDAQVQSSKYAALGQTGAMQQELERFKLEHQLTVDETQKERDWKSSEAEKDRQLSMDQLITKFEGQIREIEARMQYENPDAKRRMAEEMVTLRGRVAQMSEASKIDDPVLRQQLWEQMRRGWK